MHVQKIQKISDNSEKHQTKVINSLDYDCLAKIIMLLPIPERLQMEKVCTKWNEACQLAWYDIKKYKCESSIGRSYDNRLLSQSYVEKILLRCGIYLRELSLSNVCRSSIMPFVGNICKNLTSLECKFNVISFINYPDRFVEAFTHLDNLKSIKIKLYQYSDETNVPFEIFDSLPESINEIHIFFNCGWDEKLTSYMTLKKFKNLQKLTLSGFPLNNIIYQEIAEKTTLVHLSITSYIPPDEFSLFKKLVNLEHIDIPLFCCTKILNTILCTCKNLKHLSVPFGGYDVTKIPLKHWMNLRNLEYLCITCDIIPELANTIVKYCDKLKHLKICSLNNSIDKTSLKKFTKLKNLECLILDGCRFTLEEQSIIAITKNCKKIKRLEIYNKIIESASHSYRPSSLRVLDRLTKLKYLEHLNLKRAENLRDSTIIGIANNCENLKILEIFGCINITDRGLVALANLKNLQKLDVGRLNMTDTCIAKLRGLKELHCYDCKYLTAVGFIQFIKNNPDLEVLNVYDTSHNTVQLITAAHEITKSRTNGVVLHIKTDNLLTKQFPIPIFEESQWLVIDYIANN